jgi:hypothetical protein
VDGSTAEPHWEALGPCTDELIQTTHSDRARPIHDGIASPLFIELHPMLAVESLASFDDTLCPPIGSFHELIAVLGSGDRGKRESPFTDA